MELYFQYLCLTIDQSSIRNLRRAYSLILASKELSSAVLPILNNKLQQIALFNKLKLPEGSSFNDLYALYKRDKMERRVKRKPKTWSKYYLTKGNFDALRYALECKKDDLIGDEPFFRDLARIAGRQSLTAIKQLQGVYAADNEGMMYIVRDVALNTAIIANNTPVIDYLLSTALTRESYKQILHAGCVTGNLAWVFFALQHVLLDGYDLKMAAKAKHKHVIDFLLTKLEDNEQLLMGYIEGGHVNEAMELIKIHPITGWNLHYALYRAVESKNKFLIDYFFEQVPNFILVDALDLAIQTDMDTFKYIFFKRKWTKEELEEPLGSAVFYENEDIIRFLLEHGADVTDEAKELLQLI